MKQFISLLACSLLAFTLCACSLLRPAPVEFSVTTAEPIVNPEQGSEEPKFSSSVPYAEHYGIVFPEEYSLTTGISILDSPSEKVFCLEAPYYCYMKKSTTWEYVPSDEKAQLYKNGPSFITVKDLTLSPDEEDGRMRMSFVLGLGAKDGMDFVCEEGCNPEEYLISEFFPDFIFFDYYTGMTIAPPFFVTPSLESQKVDSSLTTEINGESVHIKLDASEIIWCDEKTELEAAEDGKMKKHVHVEGQGEYSFTIPKDYDGLCMAVLNNQYPDDFVYEQVNYQNFMVSMSLAELAEKEGIKDLNEELYYVRLNDLLKVFEENA